MFEQTFLSEPKTARKPYSMLLSLLLQIVVIGILCLLPIVFTQVLPSMQLKTVLAAPPKPPAALKMKISAAHVTTGAAKTFWFSKLPLRAVQPARNNASDVEAPPNIELGTSDQEGIPGGVIEGAALPPPVPDKPKPQQQKPIRVGTIAGANLIRMVQPVYPALARASRVQGTVEFTATISKEGTIENLLLLHGHPLLVNAAKEAVLQWRYRPTMLNGEPVEVITDIVVNFTLNQ